MKPIPLRAYLIVLFIGVVLVVTTLSTAFGVNQASTGIRDSVIARQRDAGVGAANNILYLFDSGERSLTSTASLISASDLRAPRPDAIGPVLDPLVAFSGQFAAAYLVNHTGEVVVARPPQAAQPAPNFAGEPALEEAATTHQPVLTMPGVPRRPFWIVQVPASEGSPRPYFVVGVLDTNLIENILFNNIERTDQAVLLNDQNIVIASTEPTVRPDAFAGWQPIRRLQQDQGSHAEGDAPTNGERVLVTASTLDPEYPALVALMSPKSEITTVQGQLIRSAILSSLGLALATIVVGILVTSSITRPLEGVRSATRRMREGDLTVRATPRGARELQDLANDFNTMAQTLSTEWQQRVQLQNHLEEMVTKRTEELEAKRQEMELFFYGVSHDFKSPVISINNIIAMAEEKLAEKPVDHAALLDMVQRVRRSGAALSKLTNELLQFAQAERAAPSYTEVNLDALLQSLVDEFKPIAREQKIRIETSGDAGHIRSDPDRVRHIVANLLDNAIKYMPDKPGARVRLAWRRGKKYVDITIHDNGLGIPASVQKTLFRPFMRHDPSGTAVSGAGLGLSIVKRMTESLKGDIKLESVPGNGTTFHVRLPVRPEGQP